MSGDRMPAVRQAAADLEVLAGGMTAAEAAGALSCVLHKTQLAMMQRPELGPQQPIAVGLFNAMVLLVPRMVPPADHDHAGCEAFAATLNRLQVAQFPGADFA